MRIASISLWHLTHKSQNQMAYFADLTPYSYLHAQRSRLLLNVGWLGGGHAFPTALPSDEVLSALFTACKTRVNLTRGFHACSLCRSPGYPTKADWEGEVLQLGSAEIRVAHKNGLTFAAPNLIFHYVKEHHYLPPPIFLEALLDPDLS